MKQGKKTITLYSVERSDNNKGFFQTDTEHFFSRSEAMQYAIGLRDHLTKEERKHTEITIYENEFDPSQFAEAVAMAWTEAGNYFDWTPGETATAAHYVDINTERSLNNDY